MSATKESVSRKPRKKAQAAKPPTKPPRFWLPENAAAEVKRLVGSGSLLMTTSGDSVFGGLNIDHDGECASLIQLSPDDGLLSLQLYKELRRIERLYSHLATKVAVRVSCDGMDAEIFETNGGLNLRGGGR